MQYNNNIRDKSKRNKSNSSFFKKNKVNKACQTTQLLTIQQYNKVFLK